MDEVVSRIVANAADLEATNIIGDDLFGHLVDVDIHSPTEDMHTLFAHVTACLRKGLVEGLTSITGDELDGISPEVILQVIQQLDQGEVDGMPLLIGS